jgi:hypothetical protein
MQIPRKAVIAKRMKLVSNMKPLLIALQSARNGSRSKHDVRESRVTWFAASNSGMGRTRHWATTIAVGGFSRSLCDGFNFTQ